MYSQKSILVEIAAGYSKLRNSDGGDYIDPKLGHLIKGGRTFQVSYNYYVRIKSFRSIKV